ncbi:hypothetical protein B566_EDAN009676 [Ephemera danica]|nr:hypothetical protein B566_EDAN009676 [Ephemera danica]
MSSLSKRDIEELKPHLDKLVLKYLGNSEPSVVSTAVHCLSSGYDKRKTSDKLSGFVDSHKAAKLSERIFELVDSARISSSGGHKSSRKRSHRDDDERDSKRSKNREPKDKEVGLISKDMLPYFQFLIVLSSLQNITRVVHLYVNSNDFANARVCTQIKEMMMNAQRMIEERKKALSIIRAEENTRPGARPNMFDLQAPSTAHSLAEAEKARKIAQLQASIQNKLNSGLLSAAVAAAAAQSKNAGPSKPTPLILDSEGRTVDKEGKEIQLTVRQPTLKANIRAKKREEFRQQLADNKPGEELTEMKYFDARIAAKPSIRNKRGLKFHEPGKFQALADRIRMKAQLERLQSEISQIARKTGITSATKLALITPSTDTREELVPNVEWYTITDDGKTIYQGGAITNLVEHPTQMRAPTDPLRAIYMPVFLTKKEQKKLRRQNRREAWKEEQEKIRLGLEPAPEPKLRISNLMRVLGTEAVQDPTKIESHVRDQMAKRQKAHEEANAARRLTPEQRRDKKIRKIKEDTTLGVQVAVYRISDLSNPSKKFKVETNAKQLFLTGVVVLFKDCNVVVVEGGPKQLKKYKRLMTARIKWEEDVVKDSDGNDMHNKCVLVWEGTDKQRNFSDLKFKACPTERAARELFKKHKVEHHWDLAYSGAVLETAPDAN